MSVSYIPEKVKVRLWGKAAGRCEYDGCNRPLWLDELTKAEFNNAYIAHIIADKPAGPRGDPQLSEKLKAAISNLMLLCDAHHRLVDEEDVRGHPVERLREMKSRHEQRIEIVSAVQPEKKSHILLYGARVGEHHIHLSYGRAADAMIPVRYPASTQPIELSLQNTSFVDAEPDYWTLERAQLRRQFMQSVAPRLAHGGIEHLSVFAIAPQPLLIQLGSLLSDVAAADIYQLHREPPDWKWRDYPEGFSYRILAPRDRSKSVALILSLSANITNERISEVLKEPFSVWRFTIEDPHNDFLRSREQLRQFRTDFRRLLDRVKAHHGHKATLHVFPAVPVSVAIEIGRVWMPKADLPLRIYDQNAKLGGFVHVYDLCAQSCPTSLKRS
jgi:hypothetical protein